MCLFIIRQVDTLDFREELSDLCWELADVLFPHGADVDCMAEDLLPMLAAL